MSRITAAIIIIGNEILSGRTQDTNTNFIASKLPDNGIHLEEVCIIPDIKEKIVEKVKDFSSKYDYVFTTGGIGPTHDDITSESVAEAFGLKSEKNIHALEIIRAGYEKMGRKMTPIAEKMAIMPIGSKLIKNDVTGAPGFYIKNVYVMAGIPKIMQSMFMWVLSGLKGGVPIISRQISIMVGESKVATNLMNLQMKYPNIDMGSYPFIYQDQHSTSLVLRGDAHDKVEKAFEELKEMVKEYEIIA